MKVTIKNVLCVLVACLTPSVVECAVFATPSWMHTVSRNLEGRSLTAKSAQEFKQKQLAAAAAEKKVVPLAATGAAVMTLPVGFFTLRKKEKVADFVEDGAFLASFAASLVAYVANIPGALKRKKMHELHAKHADVLYALLQDPEFKKKMGVKNWEDVRRRRKKAEAVGLAVQKLGSLLSLIALRVSFIKHSPYIGCPSLAAALLFGLGAKPLIARLMRKNGGVEHLNKEFAKAIAAAEAREKEEKMRAASV